MTADQIFCIKDCWLYISCILNTLLFHIKSDLKFINPWTVVTACIWTAYAATGLLLPSCGQML